MDDQEFLEEITHTLYGRLDAEKALFETLVLMGEKIPSDNLHMGVYDIKKKELRYFASASLKGGILIDESIKVSKRLLKEFKRFSFTRATISNNSSESHLISSLFEHYRALYKNTPFLSDKPFSTLTLTPLISDRYAGCFSLVAVKKDQYKKEHVKLYEKMTRPLTGALQNLIMHKDMQKKNLILTELNKSLSIRLGHEGGQIIGRDAGLKEVDFLIRQVAPLPSPVLITGETGTGKELIAHEIHRLSKRPGGAFVCVNCGAIPETLIESELFGYEKGAFTGAVDTRRGYFEQAEKGTIFLDELGELSMSAQVKLLRILQEKKFRRIGGINEHEADVRVIAATNADLPQLVLQKKFREDLYFRLNVFPLHVPPLRARKEDLKELVDYFILLKCRELNIGNIPKLDKESLKALKNYPWPGNIRELMNMIERELILYKGKSFNLLPPNLSSNPNIKRKTDGLEIKSLDQAIKDHIKKALKLSKGKIEGKNGAAEMLMLNPSTLRGKMRKYGINAETSIIKSCE